MEDLNFFKLLKNRIYCFLFIERFNKKLQIDFPKNFKRWDLIPFAFPKAISQSKQIILNTHGLQFRNFISNNSIAQIIHHCIQMDIVGIINPIGFHNMSIIEFAKYCIDTIYLEYGVISSLKVRTSDNDYCNKMNLESKFLTFEEEPDSLKGHILNVYRFLSNK